MQQFARVTYSVKVDGHVDIVVEGERGLQLMYLAFGIAAQHSFLKLRPVMVLEDGLPFRCVNVFKPPDVK